MQPMYRPSMPPQGMRAPNVPPPSGLPPPQRPPAGYRPTFPIGNMPPPGPPGAPPPMMSTAPNAMMKPHINPPIQKMAAMNINSSTTSQQFMSNGVPDSEPLVSQQQSFNINQFNEVSNNASASQNQSDEQKTPTDSFASVVNSSGSDSLQNKFKDSSQDPFASSLSPSVNQIPPPENLSLNQPHSTSTSDSGFGSHTLPKNADSSQGENHSLANTTGISSSGTMVSSSYETPKNTLASAPPQSASEGFTNISHMTPQHGFEAPKFSITHSSPLMSNPEGVASTPQFSTSLTSSQGYSGPNMPPQNSPLGSSSIGMITHASQLGPARPGMSPQSNMGPMRPGMMPQMGPPRPGMSPYDQQLGAVRPGMSPMGPPSRGMPPLRMSPVGPPSGNLPPQPSKPGPFPMSPQPDMSSPRPGMPPPPITSSFMTSASAGMPPPLISSQMAPGGPPGMPPTSSSMGSLQAPGMGGMQNRYPGANPAGSPMGGYPQGSQGRRLNPDDMPSPLQVMEEDKQTRSGEFLTNLKGGLPPLVTTDFVVKDGGNASPRFMRSTMYSVPATQDMMKQCAVPFGLVISPLADLHSNEAPIYLGTSLANGPVRCNRCKGYMSPLMMFMDGGRRYQCLLCKQINEVPPDYYCHMDSQGARADKYQRPELCLGSYEFVATPEYCKDKLLPKEPAFIFVMEMSQMMLQRGIISLLCQNMKSILESLPKDELPGQEATKSSIRVGFITYDSSVHFYKLTGLAPEMCIVCDKENMFVPVPDGVLCDIEEVSANIDKLMECIPQNFQTTRENSGTLYSAIQAGMSALKASGRAGKLFVFHSSLPQLEGAGKLKNREDRKVLGTEKEKMILSPQTTHYNNLAQDLVNVGCGVDLFIFNEGYVDLATIGQVSRLTGGQCHKYTFFQPNKDGERLLDDLKINIGRNIAFEAVMRVRTSTGVRPVDFFGHFFMSNTHDIELSVIDSSKAVAVEVKHDDKITEEDGVYIQCALLYTSVGGQRRLRILNMALNICTQMADMYKSCELDTLMNFFGKQSMFKFLDNSAKQVKENLIARTAQILACYRKNCATPSSAGQLILPELMKLLPLYVNSLTKCDALSGGQDLTCDDRSWHIYQLSTMNVEASVVYFYPRLIPLTEIDSQEVEIPPPVRTSYEKLSPDGVYLLENGLFMFMWVGSGTSSSWMKEVFGVSAPHQLDPVLAELPDLDNPVSKRVRGIIDAIREERKLHVRLFVVPQQGKHEVVMRNYLVEDKGVFGAPSYVDFLCHVHKEIRSLLS